MIVLGAHRQGMHRRRGHPEGGAVAQIPVPDGHRRRGQGREHLVAAEVVADTEPPGGRLRPGRRVPLIAEVSTTQITSPAPMVPKSRPPAALA